MVLDSTLVPTQVTQRPPVELPENGRLIEHDHPYLIQENGRHRQRRLRVEALGGRRHEFNVAQAWEQFFEEIDNSNSNDMEQGVTIHKQQQHREEEILEVCIICFNEIFTVTVIPCQHNFCRGCIVKGGCEREQHVVHYVELTSLGYRINLKKREDLNYHNYY